jgi:hypothetical protein
MGLRLDMALREPEPDDDTLRRNLSLPVQERWDQLIATARFILRGRDALQDAQVRSE